MAGIQPCKLLGPEGHEGHRRARNRRLDPHTTEGYSMSMDYLEHIRIEPSVRSGKPTIRGTRITVQDILEYLASGMSQDEVLADFPDLSPEDIRAALLFAADRERRLFSAPL